MKGVFLSGGTGSRLRPTTHTGPEQLAPVVNKPVPEYTVEDLKEAGTTEIGVILGHKGREEIQNLLGDGLDYGVEITYIVQGNPLDLAHVAGCARDFTGNDDFVMYLGDNTLKEGVVDPAESFESGDFGTDITLQETENPQQLGIADVGDQGNVTQLIEKPDEPPTNLVLIGMYVFSSAAFDVAEQLGPSWRGESEITDVIQSLLEDGHVIDSHVAEGWWKGTGKLEDTLEASQLVLEGKSLEKRGTVSEDATVDGRTESVESATIEDGAVVRGLASIMDGAVIKSSTYVDSYTPIGPNSTLEGVYIENSVVIGESSINTSGRIVDGPPGKGVNIGSADDFLPEGRRLAVGENS